MATRPPVSEGEISQLLHTERQIAPPAALASQARMRDFAAEHKRSVDRTDDFWADVAPGTRMVPALGPRVRMDLSDLSLVHGGQCNITYNCLDRNVRSGRKNKVAYVWTGEDGTERQITYGQLLDLVCRVANGSSLWELKKVTVWCSMFL
jgi:acetyl-CoA synthetase